MTIRHLLLLLVMPLLLASHTTAHAQTCAPACLSAKEQELFESFGQTLTSYLRDSSRHRQAVAEAGQSVGARIRADSALVAALEIHLDNLKSDRRRSLNGHLREAISVIERHLLFRREIYITAIALQRAEMENNLGLLIGVGDAFINNEPKRLLAPIATRLELSQRIAEINRIIAVDGPKILRQLEEDIKRLVSTGCLKQC